MLKPQIFKFFESAFAASADSQYGEFARFCDISSLYFQVLKPWNNNSEFVENCLGISKLFDSCSKLEQQCFEKLTCHSIMMMVPKQNFINLLEETSQKEGQEITD